MNADERTTVAVMKETPRLIEKYGMDKTGSIMACIAELFAVMAKHDKEVVIEAFGLIIKIGNDANKEEGPQCSVTKCDSVAVCELLVEGSWLAVCENHAKNRLMPRRGLTKP